MTVMSFIVSTLPQSISNLVIATPEPLALLLWGMLLIGLSLGLRSRSASRAPKSDRRSSGSRIRRPLGLAPQSHT